MSAARHLTLADLHAASRLVVGAVVGATHLVEAVHHSVTQGAPPLGTAPPGSTRRITGLVYRSIRGITRLTGSALDAALSRLVPLVDGPATPVATRERQAVLAALNGVLGDTLADSGSALALPMQLLHRGQPVTPTPAALAAALPRARRRVLLLVHGLCMNERAWMRGAAQVDAGPAAAQPRGTEPAWTRGLGVTVLSLRYNSGRHVSENGRELAALLQALVQSWPVPLDDLLLVTHSLGGLVARSALHLGAQSGSQSGAQSNAKPGSQPDAQRGADWVTRVRTLVCLGTPHRGAPLERGGHGIDRLLAVSPYAAPFARLGQLRSAGITDLRHGQVLDEDWHGLDRFAPGRGAPRTLPLPTGITCHAIAASLSPARGRLPAWVDALLGDGLVPVASALGHSDDPAQRLAFAPQNIAVVRGLGHLGLLSDARVHAQLRRWLAPARRRAA